MSVCLNELQLLRMQSLQPKSHRIALLQIKHPGNPTRQKWIKDMLSRKYLKETIAFYQSHPHHITPDIKPVLEPMMNKD